MPRKKLTKTQVKKKLTGLERNMYDLFLDKLGHADSIVPFSQPKMTEMHKIIQTAKRKFSRS
tara:strand:- start:222 stop:407 length:186 start_codon:yes stop_codon:yes gene_type:complete